MTQEEKDLLLKDLCGRLPYGVEVEYNNINCEVLSIDKYNEELTIWICTGYSTVVKLEDVKTYLFPLSSITEEQKKELNDKLIELELKALNDEISHIEVVKFEIDYYLKNHFDYRGLIPMDLAIDATGLNIY
jgi:hypothetical protein